MTALPLLLSEDDAREMLAGVDPRKVAPPLRFGGKVRWSRARLEAEIARLAGLTPPKPSSDDAPSAAYDGWKRGES